MKPAAKTRDATDLLKSAAILLVMLGHYAQYMAPGYYDSYFRGYAFGVVAVFFVLAGFGASFSLQNRSGASVSLAGYYLNRALRIYPAYWVALLLTASYFPEYEMLYRLEPYTVAVYLGAPFVNAPGIFWFVPAIVLCYLLAPFIHALLARVGLARYLALLVISVPVSLAVAIAYLSSSLPGNDIFTWSNLNILFYKDYFLSNLLLFSLGMAITPLINRYPFGSRGKVLPVPLLLAFALLLSLTRGAYSFYDQGYDLFLILLAPVFVAACFALCLTTVAVNIPVPFNRVTVSPGRYSYPLYLFHMLYIALLARFGLIEKNDIGSLLVFVGLLPALVLVFRGIDYGFSGGGSGVVRD
ncbi:MAG: acyltransferase family protein [Thermoleophilia bacterium]